ncbi:Integrase family protein [Sphingobium herbicidovorans NBRC 16415]|uniref:Integrase family protein n=1 Tax=Sphingobium herbicidovorans (strain ATCC 700291 / DSM 11019 / CCUG 56400 / KCTC 2939 / LMG 18315 / NBRC 16415 / MH) TaxID=1219045 RepID=A0A086P8U6_SPHHM|nr:Integrase family protein [Sphingobium herbicidovorans NBRC 16415]
MTRRVVTIGHGETKSGKALGIPLNDGCRWACYGGRRESIRFLCSHLGQALANASTRTWHAGLRLRLVAGLDVNS